MHLLLLILCWLLYTVGFCNCSMVWTVVRSKAVVLLLLTFCLLLLPLWESAIVLCFVVRYFMSILVLQSSWWGRESWLLCLICLPGVSWWLSSSSSQCHGVVCGLWLWYFLIILTYNFCYALLYVNSKFAIILIGKRELVALLSLSSCWLMIVVWLLLAVPWVCLQFWLWYFLIILTILVPVKCI